MEKSGLAVVSTNDDEKVKVRNQSHIHDDIAFSILSKLPIKSLKRFECVGKSWSLLFDNPNFMTMYRNNLLTKDHPYYHDASILLVPFGLNGETFELYSVSGERFVNRATFDWPVVSLESLYSSRFYLSGYGSVHGFFYLSCISKVILWNSSTNQFKLIPPSPYNSEPYGEVYADHEGFGYDHVRDDYKVMRHISYKDNPPLWEIYSLRTNSWRKLDVDMHHNSYDIRQLYMDGLSHWLCYNDDKYLLSFDWSNEVLLTTLLTPEMIGDDDDDDDDDCVLKQYHLLLLNGSIALSMRYKSTDTFHISILGELGVKESWTKIFTVGPFPCLHSPIGAGKKGDILFMKKDSGIVWFNLSTQMVEDLGIGTIDFGCEIVIHKKSLLPFEGANV